MPINKIKIGCVIPCYKGGKKTLDVIKVAQNYVDLIVLIDDKCPFKTGDKVKNIFSTSNKVKVIFNLRNLGVGGATKIGINFLMISFGASFGFAVMGRISLLVGRFTDLIVFSGSDYNYATFWVLFGVVGFLGFAAFQNKNENSQSHDNTIYEMEEE